MSHDIFRWLNCIRFPRLLSLASPLPVDLNKSARIIPIQTTPGADLDYREYAVPASLRRHIRCLWRLRDASPPPATQTIYPDGHCELIVHLGQPMHACHPQRGWQPQGHALFAAQHRTAIQLTAHGPLDCLGVRLQPAASAAVAGKALRGLRDEIIDLTTLDTEFALPFSLAVAQAAATENFEPLWSLLELRFLAYAIDARIESAAQSLQTQQGRNRVEPMASAAAMSLRAFQIRFLECVGLSPKEFARVQRLQATLHMLDNGAASLAQVAANSGFADQAHATRELHRLTGLTPARLLTALRTNRCGDRTIQLAAAFVRGYGSGSAHPA